MNKSAFFSFFFIILAHTSLGQKFMHGAGTGVFINFGTGINKSMPTILTYCPRINIVDRENFSVSSGLPFSLGFGSDYNLNSQNGVTDVSSSTTFIINVPAMFNINLGAGASKLSTKRTGFFAGAGFAYQYGSYASKFFNNATNEYEKFNSDAWGPAANIGIRFAVGKRQKNIEARVSYMGSVTEHKISAVGIAALFNF